MSYLIDTLSGRKIRARGADEWISILASSFPMIRLISRRPLQPKNQISKVSKKDSKHTKSSNFISSAREAEIFSLPRERDREKEHNSLFSFFSTITVEENKQCIRKRGPLPSLFPISLSSDPGVSIHRIFLSL
ncbi:hypothetical protein TNCV_4537101 [Trichonephila clavipes]|nr:hypothetical protein TNCV_4537101 [Trichonephila clavipes]